MNTTTKTKTENLWCNLSSEFTSGCKSFINNKVIIRISEDEYKLDNWVIMNNIIHNSPKLYQYNKEDFFNNFKIKKSRSIAIRDLDDNIVEYDCQINIKEK